jgi:apolipoprotein N-acyltransferase
MSAISEEKNNRFAAWKKSVPFGGAVLSGLLLALSFPPHQATFLGWIALVPLIMVCSGATKRRAALLGWLAGAVFFVCSLYWVRHVTWAGYLGLACYCAVYFIPVSVFIGMRPGGWGGMERLKNLGWMGLLALVWAASEYMRATLLTGFPWNLLGVSQYTQTSLIQIVEWGGVYLLSALMVFLNAGIAVTLMQYVSGQRSRGYKLHVELMVAVLLTALAATYGFRVLLHEEAPGEPVRAALIQPNIPEVGNWDTPKPELVYARLEKWTDLAVRIPNIDLVIWPETALPDFVRYSSRSLAMVRRFAARGVPLLVGTMDREFNEIGEMDFFNSSMLFNSRGDLLEIYNKQHLVLFGEYIPFEEKIPLINALTPINSSFTPGKKTTLFSLSGDNRPFSVLICFEDILPYLARRAALNGARWLVNQTNDSWFDPDPGSAQHMAHALFRTVETRLPLIRCTNTGVTCSIDAKGRITRTLPPRTEGILTVEVTPAAEGARLTFYTRHGDLFARTCLFAAIAFFVGSFISQKLRKRSATEELPEGES